MCFYIFTILFTGFLCRIVFIYRPYGEVADDSSHFITQFTQSISLSESVQSSNSDDAGTALFSCKYC